MPAAHIGGMTLPPDETGPDIRPAVESTDDFSAVFGAIHALAVSSPVALGESQDYQRGWDEAMAAVASVAGSYEPSFTYRATDGHTGMIDIAASTIPDMHRMGFLVQRRAVAPWETVPKGSRD